MEMLSGWAIVRASKTTAVIWKRAPRTPPCTLLDFSQGRGSVSGREPHVLAPGDECTAATATARNSGEYGFRLPSPVDNRPLTFEEFLARSSQRLYVSATPGKWELEQTKGEVTEQVIRPRDHGSAGGSAAHHRPGG